MEYNVAAVLDTVESAVPDRACIVHRRRARTYREFGDRTRQLAGALRARGLGRVVDRASLRPHESGQDHVALYLHNCPEYLEGMVGAFKARVAPFNVNYRYVAEELEYLLVDAGARAVIYHSAFAPTLAEVRDRVPTVEVLWQVPDDSGNELLDGAEWYDDALAGQPTSLPADLTASWSPDDLYVLYTGGTTGMPKGVLWRQADIFVAALGGRRLEDAREWPSHDDIAANALTGGTRMLPGPPFMHGAAHWVAFNFFTNGNTVVIPDAVAHLDPGDLLTTVERDAVNVLLIVGDAFGRPLVEAIEANARSAEPRDLSSLLAVASGGAALSAGVKQRLLTALPSIVVLDGLGSSETGPQGSQVTAAGMEASTGDFAPSPGMAILSEDLTHVLEPGDEGLGWLAQAGRVPLGYLGDPSKTARTFPTVDGVRYSVPGDRARLRADGTLELLGRDSVTINTGGEKVFVEEVEQALVRHPAVFDCVVAGRPSPRWGTEVVAVVQLVGGTEASDEDLLEEAARHLARYKLPKAIVRCDRIQRSPAGKADYRWAREQALAAAPGSAPSGGTAAGAGTTP